MRTFALKKTGFRNRGLATVALILGVALVFDLSTDRSFGAMMLSSLPISLISLFYLLCGPFFNEKGRRIAAINFTTGSFLILLITILFSLLGESQEKTGELIFTYAELILSFPASLSGPIISTWFEPILRNNFGLRITCSWVVGIAIAAIQWRILRWLRKNANRANK